MRIHPAIWIGLMLVATSITARAAIVAAAVPDKNDVKMAVLAGVAEVIGLLITAIGFLITAGDEHEPPPVRAATVIAAGLSIVAAMIAGR